MRTLLVYESMFGNTEKVAAAIAEGLGRDNKVSDNRVDVREVGRAPLAIDPDVDLLVVGAPTHVHGLSRPKTRASAVQQATEPLVSTGVGVREWLQLVGRIPAGTKVATFDTRVAKSRWLTGSAAKTAACLLRRQRGVVAVAPESFFVAGMNGPLREGELDRARTWGAALAIPKP